MQVLPLGLVQVWQGVNRLRLPSPQEGDGIFLWQRCPKFMKVLVDLGIHRGTSAETAALDSGHLHTQTAAVSLAETSIVSALGWWMQKLIAWLSVTMPGLQISGEQPWAN